MCLVVPLCSCFVGETTDIKFLCLNGTVFDQETRVCERVDEVDCSKTEGFYNLNLELYGNNAALRWGAIALELMSGDGHLYTLYW